MLQSVVSSLAAGEVKTVATNGGAHPSRVWGQMLTNKIVAVSDSAPPPIRDQAHAFRERVRTIAAHYIAEARRDSVAHLAAKLEAEGLKSAAEFIRAQEIG